MEQAQLDAIAFQVAEKIMNQYPRLDIQISFEPIPRRSHTYYRKLTISAYGTGEKETYLLDCLYAPPKTLEVIIAMELEAVTHFYVQKFIHALRVKLQRTNISA